MSEPQRTLVLDAVNVNQKIKRIAYQIFENNFKEKVLILAGIDGQGYTFAKLLARELESIAPIEPKVVKVTLDKFAPLQGAVELDCEAKDLKKKCIVLIDDVLNTGRTLAFGMKPFLEIEVKKLEVAVLVNRSHTQFPVTPTYTGYALTTTLTDHVEVVLGKQAAVYLK
ncbi:MAG: phosphoribosyltransferase [Bacteroidota bacterium]|nr:MAG: phosphoribosyltransferase [Bacteroidetes bacterium OLB12]GIL22509.1 MAG: phosphoribosyltransferase [Bacteroidota bacterium]HNT51117.1 phosphoribosyltransferase family protein [Cyclobacteriaceae bacterium]